MNENSAQSLVALSVTYAGAHALNEQDTVIGIQSVGGRAVQLVLSPKALDELVSALSRLVKLRAEGHYDPPSADSLH